MKLSELKTQVDAFRTASKFRSGDMTTFSVPFLPLEVELPGASDPDAYLSTVKAKFKLNYDGTRCLVVGAGNAGLCAALMNLGVKEVVASDDRDRYHGAMDEVIRLLSELHEFDPLTYRSWPSPGVMLGEFDLIFFPEALEECREPCQTLETLCGLLKPDGRLIVELQHGQQSVLKDPVNSFRPTVDAFIAMMTEITGTEPLAQIPGRAQNRVIYEIARSHQLGRAASAPAAPLPAFPRATKPKSVLPPKFETPQPSEAAPEPEPMKSEPEEVKKLEPEPKKSSDPEHDPRLGHMLKGPPLSDAALARHKEYAADSKLEVEVPVNKPEDEPVILLDSADEVKVKTSKKTKKKTKKKKKKSTRSKPDSSES